MQKANVGVVDVTSEQNNRCTVCMYVCGEKQNSNLEKPETKVKDKASENTDLDECNIYWIHMYTADC